MTDDARAVVGWLALALQKSPGNTGILSAADAVSYDILADGTREQYRHRISGHEGPIVFVQWRGGPLATHVATALAAVADPPGAIQVQPPQTAGTGTNADVVIGNVGVLLHCDDPDPDAKPRFTASRPPWQWPDPLGTDGTARAVVVWQHQPDSTTGMASVLHVPADAVPARGQLLFDFDHSHPDWVSPDRAIMLDNARYDAPVRLRRAEAGWSLDNAREFALTELYRLGREPGIIAVRMPDPAQVYLRYSNSPTTPGLEIVADLVTATPSAGTSGYEPLRFPSMHDRMRATGPVADAWAYLAPVVLAAATPPEQIPTHLAICPLGIAAGAQWTFRLTIESLAPFQKPLPPAT